MIFHSYVKLPEGTIYIYIRYYITHGYRSHSNSMACVCEPKWHCRCVFSIPLKDVSLFGDHLAIGGWNGSTCQSLRTLHVHGGKMKPNVKSTGTSVKICQNSKRPYQVGGFHWCPRTDTNLAPSCRSSSSGSSAWRSVFCQKPLGSSTSTTALVRVELLFVELKGGC